jgi:hypothetical protein
MLKPERVSAAIKSRGKKAPMAPSTGRQEDRRFGVYQFLEPLADQGNPTPQGHTRSKCLAHGRDLTPAEPAETVLWYASDSMPGWTTFKRSSAECSELGRTYSQRLKYSGNPCCLVPTIQAL